MIETTTHNGLPIFVLDIGSDQTGIREIALVDVPATKMDYQKFNEHKQSFATNETRRIVMGPAMVPDTLMYRDDKRGKYYVLFTKESIEATVLKFFRDNNIHKVNLMHNTNELVEDVFLFESFIVDSARGIAAPEGFDCPDGTWFTSYKVLNDEVWEKVVSGDFKGFSIEGNFAHKPLTETDEEIDQEDIVEAKELVNMLDKILKKI